MDLSNDKNVKLRPSGYRTAKRAFSTAIAMESNVVNNAYGYYENGKWIDPVRDRTGYGFTMTRNGQTTGRWRSD